MYYIIFKHTHTRKDASEYLSFLLGEIARNERKTPDKVNNNIIYEHPIIKS